MPEWISRAPLPASTREGEQKLIDYPLVNDELALLWMVNMGCIDMNAWYSRVDRPERPDYVVFDLDPSPGRRVRRDDRSCAARKAGARAARPRQLSQDERLARHPRPRPDRATAHLRRDAPVRRDRRRRDRARATRDWRPRSGRRAKRRGVLVDANQNGFGQDHRDGLLGATAGGRAHLDAAALGRGAAGPRSHGVHDRRGPRPRRPRRRSLRPCAPLGQSLAKAMRALS